MSVPFPMQFQRRKYVLWDKYVGIIHYRGLCAHTPPPYQSLIYDIQKLRHRERLIIIYY